MRHDAAADTATATFTLPSPTILYPIAQAAAVSVAGAVSAATALAEAAPATRALYTGAISAAHPSIPAAKAVASTSPPHPSRLPPRVLHRNHMRPRADSMA